MAASIRVVLTDEFKPIAPYSPGVALGNTLYSSGVIAQGPDGKLVEGDIEVQTRQALENLAALAKSADTDLSNTVKTTIFLVDMARDYAGMNKVYAEFFPKNPPARSTVQVSKLALGALIEIEAVIAIP